MNRHRSAEELRRRLAETRLMLVFTPDVCANEAAAWEALEATLAGVDAVQIRPKSRGAVSLAAETYRLTLRCLDLLAGHPRADEVLVLVNDRVDVAAALLREGCAGCHVGQDDTPPEVARAVLGPDALLGLSTHDLKQVALAETEPVDYLGFGPFRPTATKGYDRGLGSERCWVAHASTDRPLFPIGGIDAQSAGELADIGRAAVGAALLTAADPGRAATELRELLTQE